MMRKAPPLKRPISSALNSGEGPDTSSTDGRVCLSAGVVTSGVPENNIKAVFFNKGKLSEFVRKFELTS